MAIRPVLEYPHPCLRQLSLPVQDLAAAQPVVDDLLDTMIAAGHSVGIAAPQIGVNLRIVVMDCSDKVKNSLGQLVLINPELIALEGEYSMREGCMSLPDYLGTVSRPRRVTVRALTRDGETVEILAKKFEAMVIQHEIDHLDGILFIDRVSSLKTDLLRRQPPQVKAAVESSDCVGASEPFPGVQPG